MVELAVGVGIEGVLVTVDLTVVNDRSRRTPQCLTVHFTSVLFLNSNVLYHEVLSIGRCIDFADKALASDNLGLDLPELDLSFVGFSLHFPSHLEVFIAY
ncbi:hypothetical protein LOK49_LG01G00832 [Camellia lanceoleosa]|uniref:Uncharacterized protein n=1 Tax=Camellia lanceoleosa TaxID=1840588 RepID=A0ACC0J3I5_9ERIC|nr:hypothetical protein LOK49_LG01G00832 [Camellia lanceoleosa]